MQHFKIQREGIVYCLSGHCGIVFVLSPKWGHELVPTTLLQRLEHSMNVYNNPKTPQALPSTFFRYSSALSTWHLYNWCDSKLSVKHREVCSCKQPGSWQKLKLALHFSGSGWLSMQESNQILKAQSASLLQYIFTS